MAMLFSVMSFATEVTVTIGDYAAANGWENSVQQTSLTMDEVVTVTANPTTGTYNNTGKYYDSGKNWRMYQNEAPAIVVTAAEGYLLTSVTFTYESNKTGVMVDAAGAQVASGTAVALDNVASATFSVSNTNPDVSNGQARITAITVVYEAAVVEPVKLYLNAKDWGYGDARFAAYFFDPAKWVDMTKVEGEAYIYEVEVPAGYTKVIFVRMNGSTTENNWSNKWNQTGNLDIPTDGKNMFKPDGWDGETTTWSTYTPSVKYTFTQGSTWYIDFSAITGKKGANYPKADAADIDYSATAGGTVIPVTFTADVTWAEGATFIKTEEGGWAELKFTTPTEGANCAQVAADGKSYTWTTYTPEEPTYEVFKDTITNLAFDTEAWPMACTGGPSAQYSVDVYLLFYAEPNANGAYDLTAESSVTINGIDATFIEGYLENVVVFGDPKADAVIRCQWSGMNIELHLAMSASATPVTAIEIEAEDAKVEITEYEAGFDGAKAYELKVTADWINEADELTYAVEVLISEFDPTVAVGEYSASLFVNGEGDAFGMTEDAEVSVVVDGGNIIVEGYGIKAFNDNVYDIYLSGKMPVSEPTKHTVTITVNPEGAGTVTGAGEYEEGKEATLTATAAEGYEFVNWTVGEEVVSTENPYSFVVTADVALVANFEEAAPNYMVVEDEITNLVFDSESMALIGGPSTMWQVEVFLGLAEDDNLDGQWSLSPESSVTVMGFDARIIDGYVYDIDVNAPAAKAVLRVENSGFFYEYRLNMTYTPTEAIVVVIEDATVAVNESEPFPGATMKEYSLTMTANWTYAEDGVTYPVLVEVPVYDPNATEPLERLCTVTIGGNGDTDPWLGFGEGTLTITTVDGVVTAKGIVVNPYTKVAFDVTVSGKLPQGPGTGLDNVQVEVKTVKMIKNGQLIIIKNGVEYNVQGAILK